MHSPRLQQAHHAEHVQALGCTENIWRISHGVNQFRRRRSANHTILEQTNCVRSMSLLGDHERDQRQSHADKYDLAISNLTRCAGHHELAHGVGGRWNRDGRGGHRNVARLPTLRAFRRDDVFYRLIADFLTSPIDASGSRAPSFGAIHFFSLAMMSSNSL